MNEKKELSHAKRVWRRTLPYVLAMVGMNGSITVIMIRLMIR